MATSSTSVDRWSVSGGELLKKTTPFGGARFLALSSTSTASWGGSGGLQEEESASLVGTKLLTLLLAAAAAAGARLTASTRRLSRPEPRCSLMPYIRALFDVWLSWLVRSCGRGRLLVVCPFGLSCAVSPSECLGCSLDPVDGVGDRRGVLTTVLQSSESEDVLEENESAKGPGLSKSTVAAATAAAAAACTKVSSPGRPARGLMWIALGTVVTRTCQKSERRMPMCGRQAASKTYHCMIPHSWSPHRRIV